MATRPDSRSFSLWSGPRNVSTALMYSFAQRGDLTVVDEPLYAHFLQLSGRQDPGREDVLRAMPTDGNAVMRELCEQTGQRFFLKQMAHHLVGIDRHWLERLHNLFLIRDPRDMLPSLTVQIPDATLQDTGLKVQSELYDALRRIGQDPVVIDARELLLDPRGVLQSVCSRLDIPFDEAMLSWPAGPRPEDGVWAPHWYDAVHKSTGFAPYRAKTRFPERLKPLLEDCLPWYDKLCAVAVRADTKDEN
jgi:hypothetical protein